jgi:hypothetical protein
MRSALSKARSVWISEIERATRIGDVMAISRVATGDRILDPIIALAGCFTQHRILLAGSKSIEMMIELHRRGYVGAASTGNCGRPACQYDVALIDWRRRSLPDLELTVDWLGRYLRRAGVLVVWVDAQKPAGNQSLRASLEKRGYVIEQATVHDCGCALSARARQSAPRKKAA